MTRLFIFPVSKNDFAKFRYVRLSEKPKGTWMKYASISLISMIIPNIVKSCFFIRNYHFVGFLKIVKDCLWFLSCVGIFWETKAERDNIINFALKLKADTL